MHWRVRHQVNTLQQNHLSNSIPATLKIEHRCAEWVEGCMNDAAIVHGMVCMLVCESCLYSAKTAAEVIRLCAQAWLCHKLYFAICRVQALRF